MSSHPTVPEMAYQLGHAIFVDDLDPAVAVELFLQEHPDAERLLPIALRMVQYAFTNALMETAGDHDPAPPPGIPRTTPTAGTVRHRVIRRASLSQGDDDHEAVVQEFLAAVARWERGA